MAGTGAIQCSVITPERTVLECEATFIAFPAHDGEMGVLNMRAPLVCKLGLGMLRVEGPDGNSSILIDGGFAQVVNNKVTILSQYARLPSEIESVSARKSLADAEALPIRDEASREQRYKAIQRARLAMKVAQK